MEKIIEINNVKKSFNNIKVLELHYLFPKAKYMDY